ncbi:MAG: tetratricopeptide repeat protein [Bacillus sp. (in: firmicutes)]
MSTIEKVLKKINNGEFEEAYRHIHTIQNSGLEEDIYVLAEKLADLGFLEQAYGLYEQLWATHPEEGELLLALAEICIELDKEDEALEFVKQVRKEDTVYPSALLLEADLYALNGLEEVAYEKLQEAKKILPDEVLIDFALGEQLFAQGSFKEAIGYYQDVLKEEEEIAGISLYQRIAESYSSSGEFEEALPYYEKSLEKKLELHTLFQYGLTAFQAGQYKTAISKLEQLKDLDADFNSLYYYLAGSYEQIEDYESAYAALKEGMKHDEFNKELYFKAAKLALKLNKQDEAVAYFRESIAIDPGYLEAGITLAKYFVSKEMYEDCVELIESMSEFGESDPQFDWLLAVCFDKLEEFEKAKQYYRDAYPVYKNNEEFLREYGYFLLEEGDREVAEEIFNKLLTLSPWNEEYLAVIENMENK